MWSSDWKQLGISAPREQEPPSVPHDTGTAVLPNTEFERNLKIVYKQR
jgi:hypothetical protein